MDTTILMTKTAPKSEFKIFDIYSDIFKFNRQKPNEYIILQCLPLENNKFLVEYIARENYNNEIPTTQKILLLPENTKFKTIE